MSQRLGSEVSIPRTDQQNLLSRLNPRPHLKSQFPPVCSRIIDPCRGVNNRQAKQTTSNPRPAKRRKQHLRTRHQKRKSLIFSSFGSVVYFQQLPPSLSLSPLFRISSVLPILTLSGKYF